MEQQEGENNDLEILDENDENPEIQEDQEADCLKQANRAGPYSMCRKAGLGNKEHSLLTSIMRIYHLFNKYCIYRWICKKIWFDT